MPDLKLVALYPPHGPAFFHVCQPCFDAREPESPRTCQSCHAVTCAHVPCLCDPEKHDSVPHGAVPIRVPIVGEAMMESVTLPRIPDEVAAQVFYKSRN